MSNPQKPHFKRLGREMALQFLFQQDLAGEAPEETVLERFWEQLKCSEEFPDNRSFRKGREYATLLIEGIYANLDKIDQKIAEFSQHWDLDRMAVVDRNVMRIATYEMLFLPDVPPIVSINEAVGIAKDFSDLKAGTFINGILNGIKNSLERPARTAVEKL
jgi:N utilization substance protein B